MSTYWVTFRIEDKTVGGRTYDDRYKAFYDAIKTRCQMWWLPPTSFVVFDSTHDIDTLARAFKVALSEQHDLFLLGMTDFKSARIFGANNDQDVYKLIAFLKKA